MVYPSGMLFFRLNMYTVKSLKNCRYGQASISAFPLTVTSPSESPGRMMNVRAPRPKDT